MDRWLEIASVVFRRTPKTPLSFFNRLGWVVGSVACAALYSDITTARKELFVAFALFFLTAEFVLIAVFVWLRPEYLLYDASTHFEKWKIRRRRWPPIALITPINLRNWRNWRHNAAALNQTHFARRHAGAV